MKITNELETESIIAADPQSQRKDNHWRRIGPIARWYLHLRTRRTITALEMRRIHLLAYLWSRHLGRLPPKARNFSQYSRPTQLLKAFQLAMETRFVGCRQEYFIVQPLSFRAANLWSKGASWCTAIDPLEFVRYTVVAPLFVIVEQSVNLKYQLHIPSKLLLNHRQEDASGVIPRLGGPLARWYARQQSSFQAKLDKAVTGKYGFVAKKLVHNLNDLILLSVLEAADSCSFSTSLDILGVFGHPHLRRMTEQYGLGFKRLFLIAIFVMQKTGYRIFNIRRRLKMRRGRRLLCFPLAPGYVVCLHCDELWRWIREYMTPERFDPIDFELLPERFRLLVAECSATMRDRLMSALASDPGRLVPLTRTSTPAKILRLAELKQGQQSLPLPNRGAPNSNKILRLAELEQGQQLLPI
ncbi:MAG: hypothetical protein K1X75_16250 [Leptospirales bacterium]|nr:hypothetical protein [Leptospirales bacterium]